MTPSDNHMGELREQLAAIEHERWASWQSWVHHRGEHTTLDGKSVLAISGDQIYAWEKQIATPYAELSETEKQSDREQVERYWPLITSYLAAREAEAVREFAEELKKGATLVRYDAERYPLEPNGETDEVETEAVFVFGIDLELASRRAGIANPGEGEE